MYLICCFSWLSFPRFVTKVGPKVGEKVAIAIRAKSDKVPDPASSSIASMTSCAIENAQLDMIKSAVNDEFNDTLTHPRLNFSNRKKNDDFDDDDAPPVTRRDTFVNPKSPQAILLLP